MSSAGDFNKDGYTDILVAETSNNSPQASSYLVFGSALTNNLNASSLDGTNGIKFLSPVHDAYTDLTSSVSGNFDFNGDEYGDVILGFPRYGNGVTFVIMGFDTKVSSSAVIDLANPQNYNFLNGVQYTGAGLFYLGDYISSVGDINLDGFGDLCVSGDISTYQTQIYCTLGFSL
jgi:hypothetical protein